MTVSFGVSSMFGPLTSVAMRAPGAILSADHQKWHYGKVLNGQALVEQFNEFARLLSSSGVEIIWLPEVEDGLADSVFTYDPSFMLPSGVVLLQPGKEIRRGEVDLHRRFYSSLGIPILGNIKLPGTVEGGDCFWLDSTTIAVGRGSRSNSAGIAQFTELLHPLGIEVVSFDLPAYEDPEACLHLLSVISPVDEDLAIIYAPLLPDGLRDLMTEYGYQLLEVPEEEFETSNGLSLNVLATAPRQVIGIGGFPLTAELLRNAGCDVQVFSGDELCIPCEGGPTCLTRPLRRE
jgi:N-dimethylarginine dimethylaminohydrolase